MSQVFAPNGKSQFGEPSIDKRAAYSDTSWGSRLLFNLAYLGRSDEAEHTDFSVLPDEREYTSMKPNGAAAHVATGGTGSMPRSQPRPSNGAPFVAVGQRSQSPGRSAKRTNSQRRSVAAPAAPFASNKMIIILAAIALGLVAAHSYMTKRNDNRSHKAEAKAARSHHRHLQAKWLPGAPHRA